MYLLYLIFLVEILLFIDMSQSICLLLLDQLVVGDMPPQMIRHGALYLTKHHFRLWDMPQVLRWIEPVLL